MKLGIRWKIFFAMTGLIVFFVFLSWFINDRLLEKYYLYSKKNSLIQTCHLINDLYRQDSADIGLQLEKLENIKGVRVVVTDNNFVIKYASFFRETNPSQISQGKVPNRRKGPLFLLRSRYVKPIKAGEVKVIKDPRLNTEIIYLASRLDNGYYLLLTAHKAALKDSVVIASRFLVFTGLFTLFVGGMAVFLLSGRLIKPILEIKDIAQRMAHLDFSRKYSGRTGDELDELGESINSLSDQLERSISNLRQANEKLQQEIDLRKEFISNVSHELKTPIALIQGYAEGLKVNVIEDDENKNFYCDVITDEAAKMNRLVKQLLELARIESGAISLERVNFDVSVLLMKVLKKHEILFKEKGICLETEIEANLYVNGDIDFCEQIINNYLSNALNHLDGFNTIRIRARRLGEKTRVFVYNTGRHIPEEERDKIWTSFYKMDKARTRDYGGTGLGLSIVRAIQEAHGNQFGVDNHEGGVEFWFELDSVNHVDME